MNDYIDHKTVRRIMQSYTRNNEHSYELYNEDDFQDRRKL